MNSNIGYNCPSCHMWFPNGVIHDCPGYYQGGIYPGLPLGYIEPIKCNHCYCTPDKGQGTINPHRRCCKCGDVIAEEFIKFGDK